MQAVELLLLNTPQTVYAITDKTYDKKQVLVINHNGSLDLAMVKDNIDAKQDVEFVEKDGYVQICKKPISRN